MQFNLRRDYAQYFLPPNLSIKSFIDKVMANSLEQALEYYRDGLTGGWSEVTTIRRKVDDLFRDSTSEEQEDEALAAILSTWRSPDIQALINILTWDNLDDELDEQDLTRIARHCHDLIDQREYRVAFLMRWFYLLEATALRTRSHAELTNYAAARSPAVRHEFVHMCVPDRQLIVDSIGRMALRGRETFVREFRFALDAPSSAPLPLPADVARLSWEAHYTDLITHNLEQGEFRPLLAVLPEMFVAAPAAQGPALFDMLRHWDREIAAMEVLIAERGTPRQQADMRRFMATRRTLMDNYPQPNPPPAGLAAAIAAVIAALNGVGNSFDDLRDAVLRIAESIEGISAARLLGTADDDAAVAAINRHSELDSLALLPTAYKIVLIDRALSGACEDEEEQAVLTVLRDTKARSIAEFMQLVSATTWEKLFNAFDGGEYDDLEGLFSL